MFTQMASMPMHSPRSPIPCGGTGVSILSAGGDILIMVGIGDGTAGMTHGIGVEAGHGTIRLIGIIRGIRLLVGLTTIRIGGATPIPPAGRITCAAEHRVVDGGLPSSTEAVRDARLLSAGLLLPGLTDVSLEPALLLHGEVRQLPAREYPRLHAEQRLTHDPVIHPLSIGEQQA